VDASRRTIKAACIRILRIIVGKAIKDTPDDSLVDCPKLSPLPLTHPWLPRVHSFQQSDLIKLRKTSTT
jgi:hypothetical protein